MIYLLTSRYDSRVSIGQLSPKYEGIISPATLTQAYNSSGSTSPISISVALPRAMAARSADV